MRNNTIFKLSGVALCTAICAPVVEAASPFVSKVYEYRPAPGQFVNELPEYESGDTYQSMLEKAGEQLCGDKMPGMISLGGFGGYVVFGFDHKVANVKGEYDFKIYGNAFSAESAAAGGSCEPGAVMVSVDTNGNGLPDDEWFELAGSEYHKATTKKNFDITYFKPDESKVKDPDPSNSAITDRTYIQWTSNYADEPSGYMMRNVFHTQPYFPRWLDDEQLSFSGTRIANNAELKNGTYFLSFMDWGYVDNRPNDEDPGFNIDWAVDANGNQVELSSIDFVKVYTAVNQYCGWIGETSTELCGAEDLHPEASVCKVEFAAQAFTARCAGGSLIVESANSCNAHIYSASGVMLCAVEIAEGVNCIDITHLPAGVYLLKNKTNVAKFLK